MESHSEGKTNRDLDGTSAVQSQYPDPSRPADNPYPAILHSTYGPFSSSRQQTPNADNDPNPFPSLRPLGAFSDSQPSNNQSLDSVANEYRALAQQFHLQHGDPGSAQARNWHLQSGEDSLLLDPAAENSHDRDGSSPARTASPSASEASDDDPDLDDVLDDLDAMDESPPTRGRGRGRPRKRGGTGATTRKGWRALLKGTGFEDVGRAPGDRKPRGTGRRGRAARRRAIDPGPQFKEYQTLASQAYMQRQLDEAADYCRLAIQANPEVFQAHSLLSEILRDQGKLGDSVTALKNGAYTVRKPEMWKRVADRALEAAGVEREATFLRLAIECYGEALKLKTQVRDDLEYELRVSKFYLYKEIGDSKMARNDCRTLLRMWPGEMELCRDYAELCAALQDKTELIRAKEAYDNAFDAHAGDDTLGDPEDAWSHANIYLELIDMIGHAAEGTRKLKRLARWILGRKDETFWDRFTEDDREFDSDVGRRGLVPEFQSGNASLDTFKYGEGLPIELRVRLGLFRLKMGYSYFSEAHRHLQPLLMYIDQAEDYHDLFLQTATAFREAGFLKEAADYYDPLRFVPEEVTEQTWMAMADCYRMLDKQDECMECFEEVINFRGPCYAAASTQLANMYEAIGESEKARLLFNEVIKLGRRDLLNDQQRKEFPDQLRLGRKKRTDDNAVSGGSEDVDGPDFVPAGEGAFAEYQLPSTAAQGHDDGTGGDQGGRTTSGKGNKKTGRGRGAKRSREELEAEGEDSSQPSLFKRPRLKATKPRRYYVAEERLRQIQDAGARVHANYGIVKTRWPAMLRGEDDQSIEQWTESASSLVDDFTAMKIFFPDRDRRAKLRAIDNSIYVRIPGAIANQEYTPPVDFHSIAFTEWHRIFADLALLYARRGEQDKCYKVLQDVLFAANVFFLAPALDRANYGTAICCGLIFNDSQYLIDLSRKLITKSDCRSSAAFQLLAAVNRLTYGSNWFNAGPTQKFMLRMVKQMDYLAMPAAAREKFDWSIQTSALEQRLARQPSETHALDPGVLLLYGHMVAAANHSHSSIPYYFRALALRPDAACVHLSVAAMWVQNSMKRQTNNRHFGIAQGLAALYRYYDLRVASGRAAHRQEAEFNVARMWHHLGLVHLAMPGYERVLGLSAAVRREWVEMAEAVAPTTESETPATATQRADDAEDFAIEAAYALQGLYALVGDERMAQRIGEEWLVM